jgi:cell wall-associated NlpC family hydrolase
MIDAAKVVAEARGWRDTPYHHQARSRGLGVDCAGLVIGVARALGLVGAQFDVSGYARRPDGASLLAECDRFMLRVAADQLAPGHVAVLRFEHDPQHLGIVADYLHGGLSLVHALGTVDGRGRVLEQRLAPDTLARLVQAYALPGVNYEGGA